MILKGFKRIIGMKEKFVQNTKLQSFMEFLHQIQVTICVFFVQNFQNFILWILGEEDFGSPLI